MPLTLGPLIAEAASLPTLEAFWTATLGRDVCARLLSFVPEHAPKAVKNRVHLDVYVGSVDRLVALGATVLAEYRPERLTLSDVEGNEFCAFLDPGMADDAAARPFAVCTDSALPEELAAWWAPRVGARIGPGPDGTPRWLSGSAGWAELTWKFVRCLDARVSPNRWRWSVRDGTTFDDPQGNEVSVAPGWSAATGTPSTSDAD